MPYACFPKHKVSLSLLCLLAVLIFSPDVYAGGMPPEGEPQDCPPIILRDEDGKIHVKGSRGLLGEGKCRKRLAVNNERGFCKAVPNRSFVCKTEGMVGCDTTKADGGTCRTIDTGGGICDCFCK